MRRARAFAGAARLAKAVFPLTLRGLVIVLLSAGLLALGVVRADLAALFWGSSFLLFAAYALVAGHLFRLALSRRRAAAARFLSVLLPTAGAFPGDQLEAHVAARLPRAFPPGFSVRFSLPMLWHTRRVDAVSARLSPGTNQKGITFSARHRGLYTSTAAVLELRDVIGLTAHHLRVALDESLTLFPSLRSIEDLGRFMGQADAATPSSRSRTRSEELLEARKYYPGDDVRRLNWKVFAHLNELFLRIGEEVPPPQSRILFVLDTTANALIPRPHAADYIDGLVEACASVMIALMARRVDVLLSMPGMRECHAFAEESRGALLTLLAGAWWTDAPWAAELPGHRSLHVVVFSSPGSPGLEPVMSAVRARGWSASLFIKGAVPEGPRRKRRARDYLLLAEQPGGRVDAARPEGVDVLGRRVRAAIADATARDIALYSGPSWGVRHAAEI